MSDAFRPERLEEYVERFRPAFRRGIQARWAAVYLHGLLCARGRKNIGTLARSVTVPPDLVVEDAAQALQHFVNQSPWDEAAVAAHYRRLLADEAGTDGVVVVSDLAVVKQGRHSVGVQRQYSAALGRKANCQVASALFALEPTAAVPLHFRLYLPRGWTQNPDRLAAAGVPEGQRHFRGKATVALELLDELRTEGWPVRTVVVGAGQGADQTFREALARRGWHYVAEAPDAADLAEGEWLATTGDLKVIGSGGAERAAEPLPLLERTRKAVAAVRRTLSEELGLDHFEGRSWRGFHHHGCLVLLALGFRLLHGVPVVGAGAAPAVPVN
jgi:SRSO17 transposase